MLQAIFDISEGKSSELVIDGVHFQMESLQKDLENDEEALNWFNLSRPAFSAPLTPPQSDFRPIPLAGQCIQSNYNPLSNGVLYDRRACLSPTIMLQLSCLPRHITLCICQIWRPS